MTFIRDILHQIWCWFPPVGVYIAALALLGVLVPLFRDLTQIGKREKAIWTAIAFALVLLEIKSIYQDRNKHDKEQADARVEQLKEFSGIADRMDKSLEKSQQQFDATMSRLNQNIGTVTGANSFCYMIFAGDQLDATNAIPTFVQVGEYPLTDLDARIVNLEEFNKLQGNVGIEQFLSTGTRKIPLGNLSVGTALINPQWKVPLSDNFNYRIFFSAKNGFWMEDLEVRRISGKRVEALRIRRQRGNKTPTIFQKIDKGFPLVGDKVEWPK